MGQLWEMLLTDRYLILPQKDRSALRQGQLFDYFQDVPSAWQNDIINIQLLLIFLTFI